MSHTHFSSRMFIRVCLLLALVAASFGVENAARAQEGDGAFIDNGSIMLGVQPQGHLNVPGGPRSALLGTRIVGVRFLATNYEGVGHDRPSEGWGAADALSRVSGWADADRGVVNLATEQFTFTADSARSVVRVGDVLRVTHEFRPSPYPALFRVDVAIENISAATVQARYRRVVDWDVEPTAFQEYVTLDAGENNAIVFTSNDGFATPDPLAGPSDRGFTGSFFDAGPKDHGALFDLDFGMLAPGQTRRFQIYMGAAASERDAMDALGFIGAEAYTLGQPSSAGKPISGAPNTFILAFTGIGGQPIVPAPTPTPTPTPTNTPTATPTNTPRSKRATPTTS
ncbi:MAG: hypothetical protein GXP42_17680, partial [Chloroflexi bacterium]|nr:hypothetical protein [Chloroflexota bacterium]